MLIYNTAVVTVTYFVGKGLFVFFLMNTTQYPPVNLG